MKNTNRLVAMAGCVVLLGVGGTFAQDWPQWRGPNRNGEVTGFKAPKSWPKELTKKWNIAVGEGVATPALVGDKLYVFSRQADKEVTRCLDAATGKEIWKAEYDASGFSGPDGQYQGPRSSPAVASGKVVTLGVHGMVSCLDAATGKVLWRKDEFQARPRFHTASSPLIIDGLCIVQLGGPGKGAIVAYDLATGNQKWKWDGDGPAYGSPVMMIVSGIKAIVTPTEQNIVAVGVADGKLLWQSKYAQGRYNAATPVVDGQTIILGSGGTTAVKIEKGGDGFVAKELWTNSVQSAGFNSPVLSNGLLFGLTQGNELFCIKTKDGQTAWSAPVGQAAGGGVSGGQGGPGGRGGRGMGGGGGYGSIIDAGTILLALTPSSQLIVFQPSDKAYTELARIKVADTPTYAHPVVSSNRVFIKDQDSVTLWTID